MDNAQRIYETTFIVNASLDDAQVDARHRPRAGHITKNGGTVNAVNKWGRKRLAYTINKKTNGFYVNIEFTAPGTRAGAARALIPARRNDPAAPDDRAGPQGPGCPRSAQAAAQPPQAAADSARRQPAAPAREPLFTETR